MLKTRSIKAEIQPTDGKRISIMSRHTLEDGVTPDPGILPEHYDEWWPELSPPAKLVGSYYKRGMSWSEFEEKYQSYIRQAEVATQITKLMNLAKEETVTILCVEEYPYKCHRRLLAEECLSIEPSLEIEIG